MKHPTKAQVQVVIDNLTKAAELAEGNCPVDMSEVEVDFDHPCGTPQCHGGWYALVTCNRRDEHGAFSDYSDGARRMAIDLGFKNENYLEVWADDNPEIWGNNGGLFMFQSNAAFKYPGRVESLDEIIDHWKGVQSRLPE